MSEQVPIEPDPVIETALRLLPVPEHREDFWDRFSVALAAEPAHEAEPATPGSARPATGDQEPPRRDDTSQVPVLELVSTDHLALVPAAIRRRSNLVLSAVAVAAAVVVVVAATSLVRSRSGDSDGTETADETETTLEDGETDTTLSTLTAPDDDPAAAAVIEWVTALSEGDMDSAWDALSESSQSDWGDKATFEAERSAFAEGYGAWAHTKPSQILVSSLAASGDGEVAVVTLVGMVEQEGSSNLRADAFPVRVVDGEARLDMDASSGELEFVVPDGGTGIGTRDAVTDDSLVIVVPAGVPAPMVRLDSGDVLECGSSDQTELTELDGGYGQRCEYTPDAGIDAGIHVFTAGFIGSDGSDITAESVVFEAA